METLITLLSSLLQGVVSLPADEAESAGSATEILGPADPDAFLAAVAAALQLDADVPPEAFDPAQLPPLDDLAPASLVASLRGSVQGRLLASLAPTAMSRSAVRLEWAAAAELVARSRCIRLGLPRCCPGSK